MIKLNKSELRALSSLTANFAEVFLGSIVIPIFLNKTFDLSQLIVLLLGLLLTIVNSVLSLKFAYFGKL